MYFPIGLFKTEEITSEIIKSHTEVKFLCKNLIQFPNMDEHRIKKDRKNGNNRSHGYNN